MNLNAGHRNCQNKLVLGNQSVAFEKIFDVVVEPLTCDWLLVTLKEHCSLLFNAFVAVNITLYEIPA